MQAAREASAGSQWGTGGIATKLRAAQLAAAAGITTGIVHAGRRAPMLRATRRRMHARAASSNPASALTAARALADLRTSSVYSEVSARWAPSCSHRRAQSPRESVG